MSNGSAKTSKCKIFTHNFVANVNKERKTLKAYYLGGTPNNK